MERKRIDKDFLWVANATPKLQEKYAGKWIAVIDRKVVGAGKTATSAFRQAKRLFPDKEPLLGVVPKKELLIL